MLAKLAQAVQNAINGAARLSQIRVEARADKTLSMEQQADAREHTDSASGDLTYQQRRGTFRYPGGRSGQVVPTDIDIEDTDDWLLVTFKGIAIQRLSAQNLRQTPAVNPAGENVEETGNAITVRADGDTFYVAHRERGVYFASGTIDDPGTVTIDAIGTHAKPEALKGGGRWGKDDLPEGTQFGPPTPTKDELAETALDTVQTFAAGPSGDVDAGGDTNSLSLRFSLGANAYEIRRILFSHADGSLILVFANFDDDHLATLRSTASLAIAGQPYRLAGTTSIDPYDEDDNTREIEWVRAGDMPTAGDLPVRVYALRLATTTDAGLMSPDQVDALREAGLPVDYDDLVNAPPPAQAPLFPSSRAFASNHLGRIQLMQHNVIRQLNREFLFSHLRQAPRPGLPDGAYSGRAARLYSRDGGLIGRLVYHGLDDQTAANRRLFTFTAQSEFARNFAPTALVVATAADGTNQQSLALTAATGGILRSARPNNDLLAVLDGNATAPLNLWVNFTNADRDPQWMFVNPDDEHPANLPLSDFARELLLRSQPVLESKARPPGGWPNAATYQGGTTQAPWIPVRFNAGLDDALWFQFGFTGHAGFEIARGINGGTVWSKWLRVQDVKEWPKLAVGNARGGEVYLPRYPGDPDFDYRSTPNAERVVAHNRQELAMRIQDDGHPAFFCSDGWARLNTILWRTTYYPTPIL